MANKKGIIAVAVTALATAGTAVTFFIRKKKSK